MTEAAIIITGAAGSLGDPLIRSFLDEGHRVVAIDRSSRPASLGAFGSQLRWFEADIGDAATIETLLDDIQQPDPAIELLVNAVGLIHSEPILRLEGGRLAPHCPDSWERVIDANLTAPFRMAATVAARMARAGGGVIVNFSSVSARGIAGQAAYAAAKAGLEAVTRVMAAELGPLGVRVNAVAPGFIDVASTRTAVSEDRRQEIIAATPVGRLGTADEVVEAVRFLWNNRFANGMILGLHGGIAM
jgi:3-oxoacyl-[acyl-carrier protein] reductase